MPEFNIKAYYQNLARTFRGGPTVPHRVANKTAGPGEFVGSPIGTAAAYLRDSTNTFASHMAHYGNYSRLSRYADYCITGDMQIVTNLQEGLIPIAEIVRRMAAGEVIHTYAYDTNSQEMKLVPIKRAWKTKKEIVWEVTFDDGQVLRCTGDHRVMMRDGSYKQAQDLRANDAMMPFHRRNWSSDRKTRGSYRWIYVTKRGWVTEHRLVMESVIGRDEREWEGMVVHHRNFVREDNSHENLAFWTQEYHQQYHAEVNNRRFADPQQRARQSFIAKQRWEPAGDLRQGLPERLKRRALDPAWQAQVKRFIERSKSQRPGQFNAGREDQKRLQNANADKDFQFEDIVKAFEIGMNWAQLSLATGHSVHKIRKRLKWAGFDSLAAFSRQHGGYIGQKLAGFDNPNADTSVTFQNVCNAYRPGMTLKALAFAAKTTPNIVLKRMKWNGFASWSDFQARYVNHKVVSVRCTNQIEDVYDLAIDTYHNFVVGEMIGGVLRGTVIHNCEMETMAEVASALDIYSHEVCAKGEYGEILKIDSNNPEIKNALIKLFYDTLNIEFNLAPWVRSLCKYGDYMLLVDHHPDYGVVNVFPMPVNEVEREEGFDPENPMRYRYRWITHANKVIEPWQVIHFRLLGNDSYLPYGMSILEAGRRAWRQLILMEDAVMVYRIVRSPERRVFYIDVGNVAPENVGQVMEKTRNNMKRNQVVDPNTGQVDLRYNALSVDEDYFIGVRGQDSGTKIDTLPGGNYTGDIEDLHYIQNKLFAALKIPKSYLGYEGDISGKCLHPDTKIALLDNSSDSIKNIAKRFEQGEELFTYTIGPDGAMACGKVLGAAKTRRNAQLVEVTLDNGERIKCTPDHLFMLRDGTYRQAKDLEPQQSLMPLYREMSTKEQDKLDGYEKVYDPGSQEFLFTHRMVADSRGIRQKGKVVHHADFCKLNNHPANLDCSMSFFEHIEYHREHANKCINSPEAIARRTSDPKWLKSASDAGKIGCLSLAAWRAKGGTHAIWNKGLTAPDDPRIARYVEHQTKHNQIVKCDNPACDVKFRRSLSINTKNGFRRFCSVPCMAEGNRIHQTEYRRKNHSKYWVEKICLHCEERFEARRVKAGKFCSILCRRSYGKYKNPRYKDRADVPSLLNHKVVSVRHLDKREDCYDLQIDTAPNFALEAGVFVHNSTLAQEDVRFARTIQHIQRVVIAELEKIAMIHLYSMGLRDEDITDFELSMANPSTINEIQRLELWRTRFEVASLASQEGVLDRTFFYRHIFKLSDQEIEAIEAGRIRDKQLQVELDSMQLRAEQEIEMGGQGAEADSIEEPPPDDGDLDDDEQTDGPMGTGSIDQVGEGSDPNRQRAAPNDMLGRAKKKKKKRDDPRKHVYNTKKNGMDPLKDLQLMRRAGTSPWAEQNERDQSDAIHEKRIGLLGRYSQLIQSLENFKIGQKKKKLL